MSRFFAKDTFSPSLTTTYYKPGIRERRPANSLTRREKEEKLPQILFTTAGGKETLHLGAQVSGYPVKTGLNAALAVSYAYLSLYSRGIAREPQKLIRRQLHKELAIHVPMIHLQYPLAHIQRQHSIAYPCLRTHYGVQIRRKS